MKDTDLWHNATTGVVKLGTPTPNQPALPKMPVATGTPLNSAARPKAYVSSAILNSQSSIQVISNTAQQLAGHAQGLPTKTLKALASGQLPPQAVIDLHGLHEAQAWLQLHAFLAAMHGAEHKNQAIKVVLVIHGKGHGHGAARNMGVIKSQLAGQLALSPHVLAFHTALPQHGGMGATYVLLKA